MILFISSAYAVVMFNNAWYYAEERALKEDDGVFGWYEFEKSPDGKYRLEPVSKRSSNRLGHDLVAVWENNPNGRLLSKIPTITAVSGKFKTDSEILLYDFGCAVRVYKRRYEPTILGYATRPEFLLMLATGGLLMIRLIATARAKLSKKLNA